MGVVHCEEPRAVSVCGPSECSATPDLLRRCLGTAGGSIDIRTPSWANGTPMLNDLVRGFEDNGGHGGTGNGVGSNGKGEGGSGLLAQMMEEHERAVRAEMWANTSGGNHMAMQGSSGIGGGSAGMEGMWVLGMHDEHQYHNFDNMEGSLKEQMDISDVSSDCNKSDEGEKINDTPDMVSTKTGSRIEVKKEDVVEVTSTLETTLAYKVKQENSVARSGGVVKNGSPKRKKKVVVSFECPALQAKKNRAAALKRLRQKKLLRTSKKKVRYQCRKKIALHRPRVRGRFATKEEVEKFKAEA